MKLHDGVLIQLLDYAEVEALPAELPEALELDISDMTDLNTSRYASALKMPHKVTLITPEDEVIISIQAHVSSPRRRQPPPKDSLPRRPPVKQGQPPPRNKPTTLSPSPSPQREGSQTLDCTPFWVVRIPSIYRTRSRHSAELTSFTGSQFGVHSTTWPSTTSAAGYGYASNAMTSVWRGSPVTSIPLGSSSISTSVRSPRCSSGR